MGRSSRIGGENEGSLESDFLNSPAWATCGSAQGKIAVGLGGGQGKGILVETQVDKSLEGRPRGVVVRTEQFDGGGPITGGVPLIQKDGG